ncbi:YbbC/YhhH family protein [Elusimicrobium minutum]|nr:YbbC/YhhH family protein [Elusimicrobium minutum]
MKTLKILIFLILIILTACKKEDVNGASKYCSMEKPILSTVSPATEPEIIVLFNEQSAIAAAEEELGYILGQELMSAQKPFKAAGCDNMWVVYGTNEVGTLSGAVHIILRKQDGKILQVFYEK